MQAYSLLQSLLPCYILLKTSEDQSQIPHVECIWFRDINYKTAVLAVFWRHLMRWEVGGIKHAKNVSMDMTARQTYLDWTFSVHNMSFWSWMGFVEINLKHCDEQFHTSAVAACPGCELALIWITVKSKSNYSFLDLSTLIEQEGYNSF